MQEDQTGGPISPAGDTRQSLRLRSDPTAATSANPSAPDLPHAPPGQRPLHFLVVDDDCIFREIIATMLRQLHIKVTKAVDGQDAVQKIKKGRYDLVISDVQMPELDGLALLTWINSQKIGLRVILVSGNQGAQDILQAFRFGALDFLGKPVSIADLQNALARHRKIFSKPAATPQVISLLNQAMHDLRNSLIATAGIARQLQKKTCCPDCKTQYESTKAIYEKLGTTINFTEDYCAQALMLGEGANICSEVLDLQKEIDQVLATLTLEIAEKKVVIAGKPTTVDGQAKVMANNLFLRSALRNLFASAIKASPVNDTITYRIQRNGACYTVRIENNRTATTICEEGKSRAPAPDYFQGASCGLGNSLELAKYFVRLHGGDISCEPQEDKSTVMLSLPVQM